MKFLGNITIGKKLFASFGLICLMFVFTGLIVVESDLSVGQDVDLVKDEVVPHTMAFIEIQRDILQIQQWLTDISATRGAKGYDDGYAQARTYFEDALRLIHLEKQWSREAGESDMAALMEDLTQNLRDYYEMGKKMAGAYIEGGPEKGNLIMGEFDPYAEKLTGMIDALVQDHKTELHDQLVRVHETSRNALIKFLVVLVTALFVSVFIGGVISSDIKKRVKQVEDAFGKAFDGDLTATINSDAKDEIGLISKSYDSLIKRLNGLMGNISDTISKLDSSSGNLSVLSDKMLEESVHTSGNAETLAAASEEMNVNVAGVASATEQAGTNIQTIVSGARQMAETIREIAANTSRGSEITRAAVTQAGDVSLKIDKLGDSAQEINTFTKTISDISEQTNLLALNATIEAARAGQAGKGFAVVASEIKDLAHQTAQATEDINEKISGVHDTTAEAVNAIKAIVNVINDINEIVSSVAAAVEEQSATTREISDNVSQAGAGIREVTENINQVSTVTADLAQDVAEVSRSARETNSAGKKVKDNSRDLSGLAENLKQMLGQFRI